MSQLLMILQLIPALLKVLQAVEEAIPKTGAGKEKLSMIKQIMELTYSATSEIWPLLEKTIGVIIATMNTVGAFRKTNG